MHSRLSVKVDDTKHVSLFHSFDDCQVVNDTVKMINDPNIESFVSSSSYTRLSTWYPWTSLEPPLTALSRRNQTMSRTKKRHAAASNQLPRRDEKNSTSPPIPLSLSLSLSLFNHPRSQSPIREEPLHALCKFVAEASTPTDVRTYTRATRLSPRQSFSIRRRAIS